MAKRSTEKAEVRAEKVIKIPKAKKAELKGTKKPGGSPKPKKEDRNKPGLRTIYSNSKYTFMTLGFGSDFKTKKCVVIFSDLPTGKVHTTTLASWNRMKLKEVREINFN